MEKIDWKDILKKIGKTIACIIIIFLIPFVLPLITRVLVHFNVFTCVEDFRNYIETFFNAYVIAYMLIVMIIVIAFMCSKDKIEEFINRHDFHIKYKDTEFTTKGIDFIEDANNKKNFVENLDIKENADNENIMLEIQRELGIIKQSKEEKNKSKNKNKDVKQQENSLAVENIIIEENKALKDENNNLRYYAAYNIINKKTKDLLHVIYCENYMEKIEFEKVLKNSYKSRNRKNTNINKNNLNKYAENKVETIEKGLKYLNILEISEDNKYLILTKYGKEFVEKYIEEEVV